MDLATHFWIRFFAGSAELLFFALHCFMSDENVCQSTSVMCVIHPHITQSDERFSIFELLFKRQQLFFVLLIKVRLRLTPLSSIDK